MTVTKIGVVGCGGRMGRMNLETIQAHPGAAIAGGIEAPGSALLGSDLGSLIGAADLGLTVGDDPRALFETADVVVDFTSPAASAAHAALAAETGTALLVGTTGLTPEQQAPLAQAAQRTAILEAANTSLGVNLLLALVEKVSAALSEDYDIEILEMHHRHKVDAPSGTALALGRAAAKGRAVELDAVADKVRDGITGARTAGHIGFATLRGGDVAGEHSVIYAADGERLELTHKASTRAVFSRGAIKAALWLHGKPPGHYAMKDVLGL